MLERILAMAALSISCVLGALPLIHMLQLESYQLPGYFRWIKRSAVQAWMGALPAVAYLFFTAFSLRIAAVITLVLAAILFIVQRQKYPSKKPLSYTKRVWRLVLAYSALTLITVVGLGLIPPIGLPMAAPLLALPLWVGLMALILQPIEAQINAWYFKDAQRILRAQPGLIRIGITGSYGKTSVKHILGTLLGEKYNVLITPGSFNTPMGVTRVIREQLRPEHQVFIAEMGARHKGDIDELCRLVTPSIGLITSIGPQHLETFGSIETVANTKFELMRALPEDGAAFFSQDGGWGEILHAQTSLKNKWLCGLTPPARVYAKDLNSGPDGCAFTLVTPEGEIQCQSVLLGRHNIRNIVISAACALQMGLTLAQIKSGISKLQSIEHRLQLIRGAGTLVIDDAFNSNPAGAEAALEVLNSFPGRHLVVTPGMVELGHEEQALNQAFGKQMAAACDIAILVGERRTRPIYQGLLEGEMPRENIHVVASLAEATTLLATLGRPGDVTLFENDLPDNYNE